jgi:hypothetical protein
MRLHWFLAAWLSFTAIAGSSLDLKSQELGIRAPAATSNRDTTAYNVKTYGAAGDGQRYVSGVTTSNDGTHVTIADGYFTSADIGKFISITGAGEGGSAVATTIAAIIDRKQIVLADAAAKSVSLARETIVYGTDDYAAINAAILATKTSEPISTDRQGAVLVFPSGIYIVKSSINVTSTFYLTIEGQRSEIFGAIRHKPVLDMVGSRYLIVRDLTIVGDSGFRPNIGIQIGRVNSTSLFSVDNQYLENVQMYGYFSLAGLYNFAVETSTFMRLHIENWASGGYGLIQDGLNHFNVTSEFVTMTLPAESPQSFNEKTFIGADIRAFGSESDAIWLGGTSRHQFLGSYTCGSRNSVVLYGSAAGRFNSLLRSEIHMECGTAGYFFTGPNSVQNVYGIVLSDFNFNCPNGSVFKADKNVTRIGMFNADITILYFQYKSSRWFDVPSRYQILGDVSGTSLGWVFPDKLIGTTNLGSEPYNGAREIYGLTAANGANIRGYLAHGPDVLTNSAELTVGGPMTISYPAAAPILRLKIRGGKIAKLQVKLPSTEELVDQQVIRIAANGTISRLDLRPATGQSVSGPPTTLSVSSPFAMQWDAGARLWWRIQ